MHRTDHTSTFQSSVELYDSLAEDYDANFARPGLRNIYDTIAWDYVSRLLPQRQAKIVDVGCGTGRLAAKWLDAGHRVIGIEQTPAMIEVLLKKDLGPRFELLRGGMEDAVVEPGCADLVAAMGSVQYSTDPALMIKKFGSWARPGGFVCVYVDSFIALILELLRLGKVDEAFERLKSRRGIWRQGRHQAEIHLFDRRALEALFLEAGLTGVVSHGLLVSASAWGRDRCSQAIEENQAAFLEFERQLSSDPVLADVGKHLLVIGQRPA